METIYVTPLGFICSCGETVATITGGSARRAATTHSTIDHDGEADVIDYPRIISRVVENERRN